MIEFVFVILISMMAGVEFGGIGGMYFVGAFIVSVFFMILVRSLNKRGATKLNDTGYAIEQGVVMFPTITVVWMLVLVCKQIFHWHKTGEWVLIDIYERENTNG